MLEFKIFFPILKPFIYLIIGTGIIIGIKTLSINIKYKKSQYKVISGNSFFKTIFDKGNYGEFLTFVFLEKLQGDNKILCNLYIPREDGTTTEIDLLMINRSGIYVFESKNYSGWIFGDEKNKNWTQSVKGGKKNKFFNPVWQNKAHISALVELLREIDIKYVYSYIVFSERCELKKISVSSPVVYILKRNKLSSTLEKDIKGRREVLSNVQINDIYKVLEKCSLADTAIKENHIKSIKSKQEEKLFPKEDFIKVSRKDQGNCESETLYNKLKEYRIATARLMSVKPYFIFSNETLDELVRAKPRNKEELLKVRGFGATKVEKYGDGILNIIFKYNNVQ
ncbi:NERD domain-containing protein [Clostridium sp.]|uniref:NERD domain-containing protein n=1 Tax=Clostridium sp. TaxID=1506 RepID=UPI0032168022